VAFGEIGGEVVLGCIGNHVPVPDRSPIPRNFFFSNVFVVCRQAVVFLLERRSEPTRPQTATVNQDGGRPGSRSRVRHGTRSTSPAISRSSFSSRSVRSPNGARRSLTPFGRGPSGWSDKRLPSSQECCTRDWSAPHTYSPAVRGRRGSNSGELLADRKMSGGGGPTSLEPPETRAAPPHRTKAQRNMIVRVSRPKPPFATGQPST
jgi:hypothetical protein